MSEDTKQLTTQTGLLTQIAESIRSLNRKGLCFIEPYKLGRIIKPIFHFTG